MKPFKWPTASSIPRDTSTQLVTNLYFNILYDKNTGGEEEKRKVKPKEKEIPDSS